MITRILAIIQLCIAFSLLSWHAATPFMGQHYTYKKEAELYDLLIKGAHQNRFESLSDIQHDSIIKEKNLLDRASDKSFFHRFFLSFITIASLPPFLLIWIILSIPIAIMVLKNRETAPTVIWLLPLIIFIYGLDNLYFGRVPKPSHEMLLFPTEEQLVPGLTGGLFEQQRQLKEAWHHYLIKEWANEEPKSEILNEQIKNGEFAFLLARLDAIKLDRSEENKTPVKEPIFLLGFLLVWNLLFALSVNRSDA